MEPSVLQHNGTSRVRLESLVRSLSEAELGRPTSDGWTVSALLAHMAFWDQRMIVLLRRWNAEGVEYSPVDADMVNDALQPLLRQLPAKAAIELCLSSAEAIDAEIARLDMDLVKRIGASGTHFRFNRGLHRNDHLDQIERALGRRTG